MPIGEKQRIEFNAHRVFSLPYLLNVFKGYFTVEAFYYIDDERVLHKVVDVYAEEGTEKSFGCHYGCGIFILRKN